MAKIVRFHAVGGPQMLSIDDLDVPLPSRGEVRIEVAAIGINRVEAMVRSGSYVTPALPSMLGSEAVGRIDAVGADVSGFKVGDRVATLPGLSIGEYGAYGELILYRADMLVRVPDHQSDIEAAATWMQYLTAFGIMWEDRLEPGDHVVITAASSSVGLAAIQLANLIGAIPIAVTRGNAKVGRLREAGATHVVVSDEEDIAQSVRRVTGGRGAAMCFDAIGGRGFTALIACLRQRGTAIIYGQLGGSTAEIPSGLMTSLDISVRGFQVKQLVVQPPKRQRAVDFISRGLAIGALRPVVDRIFTLDQIADAHRYLESNTQFGKIVVTTCPADDGRP